MEDEPVFREDLHWEFWNWLSKNPDKAKGQWPGWRGSGGTNNPSSHFCFACIYAEEANELEDSGVIPEDQCPNCPLCTDGASPLGNCLGGLFGQWYFCQNKKKKAKLARQIRDLPARTDWEWTEI